MASVTSPSLKLSLDGRLYDGPKQMGTILKKSGLVDIYYAWCPSSAKGDNKTGYVGEHRSEGAAIKAVVSTHKEEGV